MGEAGVEYACLKVLKAKGGKPEEHTTEMELKFQFNPKEYTLVKTNRYDTKTANASEAKDHSQTGFQASDPATLSLELNFDTYGRGGNNGQDQDVRNYTKILFNMMRPSAAKDANDKTSPPVVTFIWGKVWAFDAVITTCRQTFTLFAPDGMPVRAKVTVELTQVGDPDEYINPIKGQNPTSRGDNSFTLHRVIDQETLAQLAYRYYGKAALWTRIAEANNLQTLRRLRPGVQLRIPHD